MQLVKSSIIKSNIKNFYLKGNPKTLRAKKNITVSFISKTVSIIISFLIVPLTLSYVGKVEYGIWMTLSSIIHWFTYFNIGLGNGLRNKLAEALALEDMQRARVYISSTFALISGVALILLTGFLFASRYISWNKVLNTDTIPNAELLNVVIITFLFFSINFVFKLVTDILQAQQRYAVNDIINIIAQIAGLLAIYILVKTTDGSLFNLCLVYAGKAPIVTMIAGILLFSSSLKELKPSIKYIDFKKAIPLLNLGFKFFIGQILYLIVTRSSLFLVIQFFGPEEVTVFNLAVRYMTIGTMLYMMVLTPLLAAFTEAYTKGEFVWINRTINRMNIVWLLASACIIILALGYRMFFKFWVGDQVLVPTSLIIALAISGILNMYYSKYNLFFNGIGIIKMQLYVVGAQALLIIPFSFFLFKINLGLASIVVAQIILYVPSSIVAYIQYRKIINKTATGIWSK